MREETEKSLIGVLLLRERLVDVVVGKVKPEEFSNKIAARIFARILAFWHEGKPIDLVTIGMQGDALYCAEASSLAGLATRGFAISYATQIAKTAKQDRINRELMALTQGQVVVEEKLARMLALYQQEVGNTGKEPDIASVSQRFDDFIQSGAGLGFSTGWNNFDEKYLRYCQGHIWLMGGWTSAGKTAMLIQKITNLLPTGAKILIVSTEMTEEQMYTRLVANISGIPSWRILSGNFYNGEEERVAEARKLVNESSLKIYDNLTRLEDIELAFRREALRGGVDWAAIDYVQNVQGIGSSEYERTANMARRLQSLAKEVRCCLLCLSQVSNDVGRGNTDQLEYKGGGEWSAVADVGIMLKRGKHDKYKLLYEVKKNRHGQLFQKGFEFKLDFTRLELLSEVAT